MHRPSDQEVAAERSRWLAELAQTIEDALRLGREIGIPERRCDEAMEVYGRLEAIQAEVEELRRGRQPVSRNEFGPFWTRLFPGTASPED